MWFRPLEVLQPERPAGLAEGDPDLGHLLHDGPALLHARDELHNTAREWRRHEIEVERLDQEVEA
jgi:hypothetical protein